MKLENVKAFLDKRHEYIKKWSPIFERNWNFKNETIIEILSIYAEYLHIKATHIHPMSHSIAISGTATQSTNIDLAHELKKVILKITDLDSIRIKVTDTSYYYNVLKNSLEYKLENNGYIGIDKKISYITKDISIVDVIHAFPEDFVEIMDKQEFRELKLNKIL